jgi:Xaa-Pro aminopeptidase
MTQKPTYDFPRRIKRARRLMEDRGIDALYVNAGPNMSYFAGWSAYAAGWPIWLSALIIPVEGEPTFVISKMHADILKYSDSWLKDGDIRTHMDGDDITGELGSTLKEKGLAAGYLGVEDTMWYGDYDLLTTAAPSVKVKRAGDLFDSLRQVKEPGEIEAIRRANEITVLGYRRSAEVIREGVAEYEAAMEIMKAMLEGGSESMGIGGHFRKLLPRKFEKGDIIDLDMGARWDGYSTDTARNIFVGQPSKEIDRAYQVTRECFQRTFEIVKPGIEAQEVHRFAWNYMKKHGYDQVWKIGHGIGLNQGHEAPMMQEGNRTILEPGVVFVIDPGCFITGQFRDTPIHIEDPVVVTETGCENLMDYTHDMIVV